MCGGGEEEERRKMELLTFAHLLLLFLACAPCCGDQQKISLLTKIVSPELASRRKQGQSVSIQVTAHPPISDSLMEEAGFHLCFSLVNKRVSWNQHTTCRKSSSLSFQLQLPSGVFRLRSYVTFGNRGESAAHSRGGHGVKEGGLAASEDVAWFVVEEDDWKAQAVRTDVIAEAQQRPVVSSRSEGSTLSSKFPNLRRLAAVDMSAALESDAGLQRLLSACAAAAPRRSGEASRVVVMMGNSGHLDLINNAIYSARRIGIYNIIVFGLDSSVCVDSKVALPHLQGRGASGTHCYELPEAFLRKLCGDCGPRDVWTAGFADVAVVKPSVLLAVLRLGFDALWVDSDIVLLADPFPKLGEEQDIAIQAGGTLLELDLEPEMLFRDELCTGFYYIRSSPLMATFMAHVIVELSLHENDVQFGDQASFNVVLFEWMYRNDAKINLVSLHPFSHPSGGVFFDNHELVYGKGGLAGGIDGVPPVIVHNNFLIGKDLKVQRFKRFGLWFQDRATDWEDVLKGEAGQHSEAFEVAGSTVPATNLENYLVTGNECTSKFHGEHDYFAPFSNKPLQLLRNPSNTDNRTIVTISIGRKRTWFDEYVLPRIAKYANRTNSDVVVVRRLTDCDKYEGVQIPTIHSNWDNDLGTGRDDGDLLFHDCAKEKKIQVWIDALKRYDRILYVDDTVLMKVEGSEDIFEFTERGKLGVSVESHSADNREDAIMRVICLRYGCFDNSSTEGENSGYLLYNDFEKRKLLRNRYFNSGVILFDRELHLAGLIKHAPSYVADVLLKRDQGFINYVAFIEGWEIQNLGYRWNYLGSFIGEEGEGPRGAGKGVVDYGPLDSYFVHLTTGIYTNMGSGVAGKYEMREKVLQKLDELMG